MQSALQLTIEKESLMMKGKRIAAILAGAAVLCGLLPAGVGSIAASEEENGTSLKAGFESEPEDVSAEEGFLSAFADDAAIEEPDDSSRGEFLINAEEDEYISGEEMTGDSAETTEEEKADEDSANEEDYGDDEAEMIDGVESGEEELIEIDFIGDEEDQKSGCMSDEEREQNHRFLEDELARLKEEHARISGPVRWNTRQTHNVNVGEGAALIWERDEIEDGESALAGAPADSYYYIDQVRMGPDQGQNQCCWAYAMTAVGETTASVALNCDVRQIDDSETYLAYFTHSRICGEGSFEYLSNGRFVNPFMATGTTYESAQLLTSSLGPMLEEQLPDMPTTEEDMKRAVNSNAFTSLTWDNPAYLSNHTVTNAEFLPNPNCYEDDEWYHDAAAVQAMKTALKEGHAIAVDVYIGENAAEAETLFNDKADSLYQSKSENKYNHQVAVVGWDDTFPAGNFTSTPEGDGAWICRDSHGNYQDHYKADYEKLVSSSPELFQTAKEEFLKEHEAEGLNEDAVTVEILAKYLFEQNENITADGLFYLSYYDRAYANPAILGIEKTGGLTNEYMYQYDYLGFSNCSSPQESEESGSVANVFTTEDNESLRHVSVYTAEAASHVEVQIYQLNAKAKNPEDGMLLHTQEADLRWAGYHILSMTKPITIPAGQSFSVVVTTEGPGGTPYTPYEYSCVDEGMSGAIYEYMVEPNEAGASYILEADGWTDLKDYSMSREGAQPGNALIRAFTVDAPEAESEAEETEEPDPDSDVPSPQASFSKLRFRAVNPGKKSIKLQWAKLGNITGYTIYGAKRGKKMEKLADVSMKAGSWTHKNLKKGTCYHYYLEAYRMDGGNRVVTAKAAEIFAVTAGGKYTNYKSLKLKPGKTISLKKGKTKQLKVTAVKKQKTKKVIRCRKVRFESSNPDTAAVSGKGKIKAQKPGSAIIYAYTQNGVYKTVKVNVKKR